MKVLKFGGTSVGSEKGLSQVKKIVESCSEDVIVVVSALGGITDQLLLTARLAAAGDEAYMPQCTAMIARHNELVEKIVLPENRPGVQNRLDELLDELRNIFKGVYLIRDLSPKTTDMILSYGERLSSEIVCGAVAGSVRYDAREFIKTKPLFNRHVVDFASTEKLIERRFEKMPHVAIVPGFIATDLANGDATNLGRGGSDYTAAILASTLKASALEIWTDVDGFMTADPKVINDAYVIEHLSYVEAMELCNFGAKVIYPPTIFPAYHKNIPIVIRNTFNLDSKGTAISRESSGDASRAIKGISSINDTCLITIQGLGMVGVIGVNYRIFKTLAKSGISVFLVSQAASENTTSIGVRNDDADLAMEVLTEEFAQEIALGEINKIKKEPNLATIAIVGENMKHTPGIAGKLFGTLGRSGINVIACAQGASETNISFVVSLDSLRKTLNVLHDSFFLSDYQVLNIFIAGVGLIGSNLLEQIRLQQAKLMKENSLQIRVVGATNSKRYIVDRDGLDLKTYRDELRRSENVSTPAAFRDAILSMNIFNSVFVDCTASAEVADIYKDLLEHNVSVVAANKTAASSEYDRYHELKSIARKRGVKFLFETNVGAGLPIINTISDLINSGDRILKIEAVVSGTLNYIFNEMSATVPMSKAIKMAQEAGYAEPDPRIDLSGMDVIRKLVILSREAGYRVEQADVKKHLFIPEKYFEGSVEDFWRKIPEIDAEFEQRRKKLEASGKRWRFIATMENGKTEVGLREVDSESPFYHLAGSNNVILLTTERYKEYPMQIKGYGAGAGVTAAGVFADIISIANIR
ncbi:bifunctional aspartate kinase/homoserine dehydrogenase I [Alistipes sp. dk3620]|uniref:bifunctional aspartate kinase/homoserine dehydrogenase I n=1 Tax=unclassified Alistipes TaxID=2608932 RepID=UPI001297D41F|nr:MULTISPECIES: bifunctional aspartate kinase/homoserine dehydrogenase I [unclassified Alistipes]MQX28470.1 bifunctional aspartate kinase/homoserine dehydrogenase I [Alistipes sp. dk3620]QGA22612.1 bifunctional aspartate kinase/homoserine dehydrogenase I [Alistipes sp. dk3624]